MKCLVEILLLDGASSFIKLVTTIFHTGRD